MLSLARAPNQGRLLRDRHEVGDHPGQRLEGEAFERVLAVHPEGRRVHQGVDPSHLASVIPGHGARQMTWVDRSEEHTSELQSQSNLVCRLLLEKKNALGAKWKLDRNGGTAEKGL